MTIDEIIQVAKDTLTWGGVDHEKVIFESQDLGPGYHAKTIPGDPNRIVIAPCVMQMSDLYGRQIAIHEACHVILIGRLGVYRAGEHTQAFHDLEQDAIQALMGLRCVYGKLEPDGALSAINDIPPRFRETAKHSADFHAMCYPYVSKLLTMDGETVWDIKEEEEKAA